MDTSKAICNYYTLRGLEDNYGNTIIEMSLRELMWNWLKFIEEEKMFQTNYCKMEELIDHILVDRATKWPPKIAGEVIDYYCGCENNH